MNPKENNLKTVILTGATRGIGRAIFDALNGRVNLIVIARSKKSLELLNSVAPPGTLQTCAFDLSDADEIKRFTRTMTKPIYGIINCAGVCETMKLSEYPGHTDPWSYIMAVNLQAPYLLVRSLAHQIEDGGRIVNIGSQLGHEGREGYSAYCAAKHGLAGLTKVWAKELAPRGITVNSIDPSWVMTEMCKTDIARMAKEKGISYDAMYEKLCEPLSQKRFTEPSEVADYVRFLLSPEASGITGQTMLMTEITHPK